MNALMKLTPAGQDYFQTDGTHLWLPGKKGGILALPDAPLDLGGALEAFAGFSTYLSDALLNHVFHTTKYTAPGTVYVALNNADPTDDGLNTELAIGVNGYARAAVSVADASWTAPATAGAARQITNAADVSYSTPTGDWNSGLPITWASIWDLATAGNMLASGALGTPRTILVQDNAPRFGTTALVVSLA